MGDTAVFLISDTGVHNVWSRMYRTWENNLVTSKTKQIKVQRNVADHELFGVFPSEETTCVSADFTTSFKISIIVTTD